MPCPEHNENEYMAIRFFAEFYMSSEPCEGCGKEANFLGWSDLDTRKRCPHCWNVSPDKQTQGQSCVRCTLLDDYTNMPVYTIVTKRKCTSKNANVRVINTDTR